MKFLKVLIMLAVLIMAPTAVIAADAISGDFKVVSVDNVSISEIRVTLEGVHSQGAFSAGKTYIDRWAVPAELIEKNFIPVKREWIALEGKGVMSWETLERAGYQASLYLDKGLIASGNMKFKCAIVLKNDGTMPEESAVPQLVSPTSGIFKYRQGDYISMKWSGKGPNYRIEIFDETSGKTIYASASRTPDKLINTRMFERNRRYIWSVRQAGDGLNFGPAAQEKFAQRTYSEFVWKTCGACNGAGGHYVPDPPAQPHKAWQVCYRCNGTGREQVLEDQYYLDFNM